MSRRDLELAHAAALERLIITRIHITKFGPSPALLAWQKETIRIESALYSEKFPLFPAAPLAAESVKSGCQEKSVKSVLKGF